MTRCVACELDGLGLRGQVLAEDDQVGGADSDIRRSGRRCAGWPPCRPGSARPGGRAGPAGCRRPPWPPARAGGRPWRWSRRVLGPARCWRAGADGTADGRRGTGRSASRLARPGRRRLLSCSAEPSRQPDARAPGASSHASPPAPSRCRARVGRHARASSAAGVSSARASPVTGAPPAGQRGTDVAPGCG
jgi:hypothetical protein